MWIEFDDTGERLEFIVSSTSSSRHSVRLEDEEHEESFPTTLLIGTVDGHRILAEYSARVRT